MVKKIAGPTFVVGTASEDGYQGSSTSLQQEAFKKNNLNSYMRLQDSVKLAALKF